MVCIEIPDKEKYDRDRTTYGLRYAEVHKATATFYEINLVRAKTQHPTRVLVERSVAWPYMVPFLGPGKARGNDFVFPIYFDEDPVHQFERITYANNVINQSLQRVAKRIGLTRKVTFYAARHTYASRLYHADVPLPLIAKRTPPPTHPNPPPKQPPHNTNKPHPPPPPPPPPPTPTNQNPLMKNHPLNRLFLTLHNRLINKGQKNYPHCSSREHC